MGCFGSRLDKRASAATESFNSVGLQFHGGEGSPEWKISADNFVYLQKAADKYQDLVTIYPTEGGKATGDGVAATAAFVDAYKWVEAQHKEFTDQKAKDTKNPLIGGKFPLSDVITQLDAVLAKFKETGIEVPADAPAKVEGKEEEKDKEEEKKDEAAEGGEYEYDGGEDDEKKDEAAGGDTKVEATTMAVVDPRAAHVDDQEFKGFESTPALYLRTAMTSEYFGDCLKQRLIAIEFLGNDGLKTHEKLAGATGYLCSGLSTSAREDQDSFFSGNVGELDEASLKELQKDAVISFPGWLQGWSSEEDATNYLKTQAAVNGIKDVKQVVYKITGAHVTKVLGNRVAAYRANGKVVSSAYDEKSSITTVTIAAGEFDARTVQESHDALNAPVVAPTDDTKKEETKADEDKKEPEAAAGGD